MVSPRSSHDWIQALLQSLCPFSKFKRPHANRFSPQFAFCYILPLKQMSGKDRKASPTAERWRKWSFICDAKGVFIQRLCLFHLLKVLGICSWGLVTDYCPVPEHYIFSSKFHPVCPFHPFSQVKCYYKPVF